MSERAARGPGEGVWPRAGPGRALALPAAEHPALPPHPRPGPRVPEPGTAPPASRVGAGDGPAAFVTGSALPATTV